MAFPLSRVSLCYFCLVLTCFLSFQPICVPGVRVFSCFRFQRFSWNVSALLLLACVSFVFSLFQRICVAGVRMLCLSYPYPVRWSGIALCAGSLCTTLRCSMSVFGAPLSFYVHQPTIGNPAPFSSFFSSKRSCPVQRSQKKQKRPWHAWNIKGGGQALRLFCECSSNARLKITIETRKNWAGHQHRSDAPCSHHYLLNVLYGDRFFWSCLLMVTNWAAQLISIVSLCLQDSCLHQFLPRSGRTNFGAGAKIVAKYCFVLFFLDISARSCRIPKLFGPAHVLSIFWSPNLQSVDEIRL